MEGYFNFGFTNSVRKPSTWFNNHKTNESNYKVEVEWNCDAVDKDDSIEDVDTVDTDLDSDSFLSDLERDSGEQGSGSVRDSQPRLYSEHEWNEAVMRHQASYGSSEMMRYNHNNNVMEDRLPQVYSLQLSQQSSQLPSDAPKNEEDANKLNVTDPESSPCCYMTRLDISCIIGLLSLSVMIFCLIAPHWLVTTQPERSSFVRLNPWDLCLHRMMLPPDNVTLTGCYNVWDSKLMLDGDMKLIQDWFVTVPATLLLASSLSLSARAFLFLIWFKNRQIFPLRLGVKLMFLCAMFDLVSGLLLLTTTMTFAVAALTSTWLNTSNSSLSWGWAACLTSSWGHVAVAALMARETYKERSKRRQNENFVRNLE